MKRAFSLFAFIMLLCIFTPQGWGQFYDGYISSGGSNPNGRIYYRISNSQAKLVPPAGPHAWECYESFQPAGDITIPSNIVHGGSTYTVTSIDSALGGCTGLTSVTIPNSVTSIGNNAFASCIGLSSVTIPSSVTSIGINAFSGCRALTSIVIPNSVTSIGDYAFWGCTGLTSVTIPNSVTSIRSWAFEGCSGMTSVTISNSVTSIYTGVFRDCSGLTSVTIPNSVTYIGDRAFYNCTGLTSVTIPNSVTSIGNSVFYGCSGLTSVTIGNSVTSIGSETFNGCSGLTSVTIPNSVTSIGSSAFGNCLGLTSVSFNADSCWTGSFEGDTNIANFTFGNNVRIIPSRLCFGLSGLSSITIPNTVTFIGYDAFRGCSGLTSVNFNADSCRTGSFDGDTNIANFTFGNNVRIIPPRLCFRLSRLTSVTIPNSVTSIGELAFALCGLTGTLTIPNTVTDIGIGAFAYCSGLTSAIFNAESCIVAGGNNGNGYNCSAFDGDTNITSFIFGDNVKRIPSLLCKGLSQLTSFTIPDSVTSIGEEAFQGCSGWTGSLSLPHSVTSIGNNAFQYCTGLTEIHSPNTVAPLGGTDAFGGVTTTIPVYIPCGGLNSYLSRWSYFSNFIEDRGFTFSATSSNAQMGSVQTLTAPSCTNPLAVIYASANRGYRFVQWNDSNTVNPRTIPVSGDTSFVAIFDTNCIYTVTAANCLGAGTYQRGATAIVMAAPQSGTIFRRWADGVTSNPRYVTVTSDTMLTPIFSSAGTDTVVVYDTVRLNTTVYDTTAVTHYVYDTVHHHQYDTLRVLNTVYDTTAVTHYVYDTVRVYDTLTVLNIDTVHHYHYDTVTNVHTLHYQYDTTRVFDTLTIVNMDTLHHYHYDTTAVSHYFYDTVRVFDTLTVLNIDTLHHYHYDTTRVYDTLTIVNIDTLHHYYYDTLRVFDTLTVLNVDTVHHYHYDTTAVNHYTFDTTRIYDTLTIVNVDTLHHYFYDTTRVFDTLTVLHSDTLHRYHTDTIVSFRTLYQYDTTMVYDTLHRYHADTIVSFRTLYHYDTTRVYDTLRSVRIDTVHHYFYGYTTVDTLYRYFYDTTEVTHMIFDTTTVTHYIYNTTWIVDTIYLYDTLYVGTEGINDAGWVNARVYTTGSEIVVEGIAGHTVRLYDITGRMLERRDDGYDIVRFPVPASGTYVVRIGDRTVRKVVVIL